NRSFPSGDARRSALNGPDRRGERSGLPCFSAASKQVFLMTRLLNEMNIWDQILSRVETKVNRHSFYTWFKPTSFISADSVAVTIRVPNGLFKDWLTKHYSGVISEALDEV